MKVRIGCLLVALFGVATVAGLSLLVPGVRDGRSHKALAAGDEARCAADRAKAPFQGPIPGARWNGGPGYVTLYSERRDQFVLAVEGDAAEYARRHPAERMLRLVRIETWRGTGLPLALQPGSLVLYDPTVDAPYAGMGLISGTSLRYRSKRLAKLEDKISLCQQWGDRLLLAKRVLRRLAPKKAKPTKKLSHVAWSGTVDTLRLSDTLTPPSAPGSCNRPNTR